MMSSRGRPSQVMSVRTELVREHLVESLRTAAEERARRLTVGALEEEAARLAGPESERELGPLARELARLGYAARQVEVERFEPARRPTPWLAERLAGDEEPLAVARELADAEPSGRPEPADETALWLVPGPGGHVRHYLALAAVAERAPAPSREPALKRCWLLGFFLRCCEEARAPRRPAPRR